MWDEFLDNLYEFNAWYMVRALVSVTFVVAALYGMLWLNANGLRDWNLVPMILGIVFLLVIGSSPFAVAGAAAVGTASGAGVGGGINGLFGVVLPASIVVLCGAAGFLATFPFEGNQAGFWQMVGWGFVMAAATLLWNVGGKFMYGFIMTYGAIVMIMAAANTFYPVDETIDSWVEGRDSRSFSFSVTRSSTTPKKPRLSDWHPTCREHYQYVPSSAFDCKTVALGAIALKVDLSSRYCTWVVETAKVRHGPDPNDDTVWNFYAKGKSYTDTMYKVPVGTQYGSNSCRPA